jgi:hypothetical protein
LLHTTIPRHTQPPACTASVVAGNWRQSLKVTSTAPGFEARRAALSHNVDHKMCDRWSRLSPAKSGPHTNAPVDTYFVDGACNVRSAFDVPPELYGASVTTASTLPAGSPRSHSNASPPRTSHPRIAHLAVARSGE